MMLNFSPPPEFRTCSTKIFAPNELHVTRFHHRSVLILMTEGILRFREDGQDIELCAGEYYIQRDSLFQEGVKLGECPIYFYIEFNGCYTDDNSNGLPLRGHFHPRSILPILDHLEELFKKHKANPFLLNSYMNRVFSELWALSPQHDEQAHVAQLIRNDLDARYAEPITLFDLSRRFGYDEDYLIRLFKRQYGITPHKYLVNQRIEHARWLLENTAFSAKDIADAVGYRDFPAFYRAFCKICGVSPSEYRENKGNMV